MTNKIHSVILLLFKPDTVDPSSKYDEDDDNADLSEEEADADGDATGEKNKQRREQVRS
jgi:hypothetical protein